jgi:hypothetical protein
MVHPAAVMKSKLEAGWDLVDVALRRTVELARGTFADRSGFTMDPEPLMEEVRETLRGAREVAIDTEFDAKSGVPFMVGLSVDGERVMSLDLTSWRREGYLTVLREELPRRGLRKIAHFHQADRLALAKVGVVVPEGWVDTLLGYALVYPDLPVGLSHVARHLVDGVSHWKGMAHTDPVYNAKDVAYTFKVWKVLERELARWELEGVFHDELMPASECAQEMERYGLQVDQGRQQDKLQSYEEEKEQIIAQLLARAKDLFATRAQPVTLRLAEIAMALQKLEESPSPRKCAVHPEYEGKRQPSKKVLQPLEGTLWGCECLEVYKAREAVREELARLRKERMGLKGKAERWELGFNPLNNDHLRWLLYEGLKLPKQYKRDAHGKRVLTANVDAVNLLLASKAGQAEGAREILVGCKRVQHLAKMQRTFLNPPVDKAHVAHPPYRPFGTGTGRWAGGADENLVSDHKSTGTKYNVLNIPRECRDIYVPHLAPSMSESLAVVAKEDVGTEEQEEVWSELEW